MGQIGLPCTPPPPGQSGTKFFFLLGPPPIWKVDGIKKKWDGLPVLGFFQNGRHQNQEITFCAITWILRQLESQNWCLYICFWGRVIHLCQLNMFLSCRKCINSYSNVFFVHFRSFFVLVHGSQRVTVHPPPMKVWDQVFLAHKTSPNIKSQCHQIKVGLTTCFRPFQNGRHWNLEITFCAITWVLRQLESHTWCLYICFWGRQFQLCQWKMFLSCGKFINSYSNVFFVHFRSLFVLVHGQERVTVHPPPVKVRDQVCICLLDLPLNQNSMPSNKSRMDYLF